VADARQALPGALEDIRTHVLSPEAFAAVTSKVRLVPDQAAMRAEDDEGRACDYGKEGFPSRQPDPPAREWFPAPAG
jgi:hypothetical protein